MTSNHSRMVTYPAQGTNQAIKSMPGERPIERTSTGRPIDKARPNNKTGEYHSWLTDRQRLLMRWALRQNDLGYHPADIAWVLIHYWRYEPADEIDTATVVHWVGLRSIQKNRGKVWP